MLAKKYAEMQSRRDSTPAPNRDRSQSVTSTQKRLNVNLLKDFYLKRMEVSKNGTAESVQNGANNRRGTRNRISLPKGDREDESLVLCLNTNMLQKEGLGGEFESSPSSSYQAGKTPQKENLMSPEERVKVYNERLLNFRATISDRIEKPGQKANVMRHLTQVKYHLDTAEKWTISCADVGVLSDHTVSSLGQIVQAALALVPAEYVIAKRVHTIVNSKEKFLRKMKIDAGQLAMRPEDADDFGEEAEDDKKDGTKSEVTSVVEVASDCGTQYSGTDITAASRGFNAVGPNPVPASLDVKNDVANINSLNADLMTNKTEEEQRRWFYSQCLNIKLNCPDKTKARRTLISDMYQQCREKKIPMDKWIDWISERFGVVKGSSPTSPPHPSGPATSTQQTSQQQQGFQQHQLDQTTVMPNTNSTLTIGNLSRMNERNRGKPQESPMARAVITSVQQNAGALTKDYRSNYVSTSASKNEGVSTLTSSGEADTKPTGYYSSSSVTSQQQQRQPTSVFQLEFPTAGGGFFQRR